MTELNHALNNLKGKSNNYGMMKGGQKSTHSYGGPIWQGQEVREVEKMLMLTKHVLICAKYSMCIASKNLEEVVGDCWGHLQPSALDGVTRY